MILVRPFRDQARCLALCTVLILAFGAASAHAQQPPPRAWIGKRVIQRDNNFPVRKDGEAVLRSGMEIHIYRVTCAPMVTSFGSKAKTMGRAAGDLSTSSSRWKTALAYLAKRVRSNPDNVFLYSLMSVIHADRNELDRAVDDWNKIVELEPANAESFIGRAKLRLERQEWDKAISDLTLAIKIEPNDAYSYRLRAHAWNAMRDYDKVISDCDRSIALEPRNATGPSTRAQAWLAKHEYDRAIADATTAVRLDAKLPLAYLWRGLAWSRKKNYDTAIADYTEAIRLDPQDAQVYYNRAWAWQQKGDRKRAISDYAAGVAPIPHGTPIRPCQPRRRPIQRRPPHSRRCRKNTPRAF